MAAHTPGWLIGVDASSDSLTALRWAIAQADGRDGIRLRALLAIDPGFYGFAPFAGGPLPLPTTEMEEMAKANLIARVADVAQMSTVIVDSSIAIGSPGAVLLEGAKNAELAVVGSRGRGGFASLMLGSVSLQLATHADVPIAVVPSDVPARRAKRLAVGVDGSANSRAALEWACEFAREDTTIIAVGAWRPPYVELEEVEERRRDAAKDRFVELVDDVAESHGRTIEQHFVTGNPRHALIDDALEADILVVGSRGYDGIQGALIGSVATWVLHHASCTTVVVPAGP